VIPGQYEGGKGYSIEVIYNEYGRDFPFPVYLKE
jgi:hypothetical protein